MKRRRLCLMGIIGIVLCVFGWAEATDFSTSQEKMLITFNYNKSETLTNFPALVILSTNISGFSYCQFASPSGYDLRFAASDGTTELNYDTEQWNTNGNSYVWVQVPVLTSNTTIWAFWNNSTATSAPPPYTTNGATWNANYVGVWHMQQTNAPDSTINRNNGASHGSTNATGFIGACQGFHGGQYIDCGTNSSLNVTTNMTLSAWFKANSTTAYRGIMGHGENQNYQLEFDNTGNSMRMRVHQEGNSYNFPVSLGVWYYVAGTYDGANIRLYTNGVLSSTTANVQSWTTIPAHLSLGSSGSFSENYYDGLLDETRIESIPRSSNWVWACYMTMAQNSTFSSYGQAASQELTGPVIRIK